MAGRGGPRKGAGRPKTKIAKEVKDTGFAARVLARIGELGLPNIQSAEDYALDLLRSRDERVRKETFQDLMNRTYGRAPIGVSVGKGGEDSEGDGGVRVTVEFIGASA